MSAAGPDAPAPQRILLYGATGSGKTTAARRIGERLGIPVIFADEIGWLPGWVQRPADAQRALVAPLVEADAWVFDSAYSSWSDLVIPRTELIVGLDYPRRLSLQRLVRRTVRRAVTREELFAGNRESWRQTFSSDSIIAWHFRSWRRKRDVMRAWAADPEVPPVLLFSHPRELEEWISAL